MKDILKQLIEWIEEQITLYQTRINEEEENSGLGSEEWSNYHNAKNHYEAMKEKILSLTQQRDESGIKLEDVLPHGVKLIDCPECGAEIQFGLSDELKEKIKNSKLFSPSNKSAEESGERKFSLGDVKFLCTRFAHQCRLKGVGTNNETCNLFDEWLKNQSLTPPIVKSSDKSAEDISRLLPKDFLPECNLQHRIIRLVDEYLSLKSSSSSEMGFSLDDMKKVLQEREKHSDYWSKVKRLSIDEWLKGQIQSIPQSHPKDAEEGNGSDDRLKAMDFDRADTDNLKKLLNKEGQQGAHQFQEWWDVFEIQSYCRKFNLAEINMWSILSNRFKLIPKTKP